MRRAAAIVVLIALLAPSTLASDAPRVEASAYRVDLGVLAPGEAREGTLRLSNPTTLTAETRLVPAAAASWVVLPERVALAPGQSKNVTYVYRVPTDAMPGDHGESILLVVGDAPEGSATLVAGTAIVFTSRTRSVGIGAIESPATVPPGAGVEGAVVVLNTWNATVDATVRLEWRDAGGSVRHETDLGPVRVAAEGAGRLAYRFEPANATPGAQTLTARVVATDPGDAPVSGSLSKKFHLGARSATYRLASVEDLRDGNASVVVTIENTGDVPAEVTPRIVVTDASGAERVILLAPVLLAPGERRDVTGVVNLAQGRFSIVAEAEGAEAAVMRAAQDDAPLELHMRPPEPPSGTDSPPREPVPWGRVLVALAVGSGAMLVGFLTVALARAAWRYHKRRPARPTVGAPVALAAQPDAFDDLFARIEAEEPKPPAIRVRPAVASAVVLVDLVTFGGVQALPRLREHLAAWRIDAAVAFAAAEDDAATAPLHDDVRRAGYTPRISVGARAIPVEITIEAMRHAREGRIVLLATHDPALAPLARALRADGARVELVGLPRRIPVILRDAVDVVHEPRA